MEKYKFKTNIKCMGCVAVVTPKLDELVGTGNWSVDLQSVDKVLTVEAKSEHVSPDGIKQALASVGYLGTDY